MENKKSKSLFVAIAGITASLYITLGYVFQPISFLGIQFRIAEIMVGMCIIYGYSGLIGKIIGVLIVNLVSPLGPIDLLSVIVNIPALCCIIVFRERKYLQYFGGFLYAFIISVYVACILNFILGLSFSLMLIQVFISEIILTTLGISIFNYIKDKIPETYLL